MRAFSEKWEQFRENMLELFPNFVFFGVFGLLVFVLKTTNQMHRARTKTCSTVLKTKNCFQNR
jgi:hypothetical protein